MSIILKRAEKTDVPLLHAMQVAAYLPVLYKFHDTQWNPANETIASMQKKFENQHSGYHLIVTEKDQEPVGGVRIQKVTTERYQIGPLFIAPNYQKHGYASQALKQIELLYPDVEIWELQTILQERYLCRLYEKAGFVPTGVYESINEQLTLIYYHKVMK